MSYRNSFISMTQIHIIKMIEDKIKIIEILINKIRISNTKNINNQYKFNTIMFINLHHIKKKLMKLLKIKMFIKIFY